MNNEALDFAYGMGLRREVKEEETDYSALDFAYAMGLRRYADGLDTPAKPSRRNNHYAQPSFA